MYPISPDFSTKVEKTSTNSTIKSMGFDFVERIKQIAQSFMRKMDEIYGKLGVVGIAGLMAVSSFAFSLLSPPALVIEAIIGAEIALCIIFEHRHRSLVDNELFQKWNGIEREVAKFHAEMANENFVEKFKNSQSSAELEVNLKAVMDSISVFKNNLKIVAEKNHLENGYEDHLFDDLKSGFVNFEKTFENKLYTQDLWKEKQADSAYFFKFAQEQVEKKLKTLRSLISRLKP
jgi:hypothetical protein